MCYNAPVSFGTFAFVTCICLFLLIRNRGIDRAISGILFVVVLMQLVEGFIWLNPECNDANKQIASLIPILLVLQPILITLIIVVTNASRFQHFYLFPLLFLPALPFLYSYLNKFTGQCLQADCTTGHLDWSSVINVDNTLTFPYLVYNVAMVVPIATLRNPLFAGVYLASSLLTRVFLEAKYKRAWASIWCHFVNILAVVALV